MPETKEKVLRVRLTAHELQKLKAFAEGRGVTASHVIHEYIRRLPNSTNKQFDAVS
jgi:hypothetical protein